MLKYMRAGAQSTVIKFVLFGVLLLAMGGLALIGGGGNMFKEALKDDTIATINGTKLSAASFDRMVQNVLRDQHVKQSDAYRANVPMQILKQEIINPRIFSLAADDLGIEVDDSLAAQQVKELIAPLQEKGMTPQEALSRVEQSENTNESGLVGAIKSEIAREQLLQLVSSGVTVPQQLTQDALKFRNEYRNGAYFHLTAANAGDIKAPGDADLKSYYTSISGEYALPEYRTLSVLILDKKALGDSAKVSDDRLKQYYDENIAEYQTGESRVISQVVSPDEATAKAVYAAALKSKDLQAASKGKGGYIKPQPFTEKEIAPELSKTAFSGQAGDVLPPVQSPLGWHVIYIEKISPGSKKSFDSVKGDIEKELSQDKTSEALYERANKIDEEISGGKSLADVAKENNLTETKLTKIDAHGVGADGKKVDTKLPLFDKLVSTGFTLSQGSASQLIETPDGAFAIVGVDEIIPSEQQPFDKVREKVMTRWMADHQLKALTDTAAQIDLRLKKGESFDKIAAEYKQPVQTTGLVQRGTSPAAVKMDSSLVATLFSLDKVGQSKSFSGDNTVTVVRLADRKIQVPSEISKKDTEDLSAAMVRTLKQDLLEQYRQSLLTKYDVKINDRLMSSMYAAKDENDNGGAAESEE
jgi:peptidyl-prolyl cis-trans isomerase D